jgi:hypothetical protein
MELQLSLGPYLRERSGLILAGCLGPYILKSIKLANAIIKFYNADTGLFQRKRNT